MYRLTFALIILISFSVNGQNKSQRRKNDLINKTIGSWEFRPGDFKVAGQKGTQSMYFETWHTERIEFLPNMDYKFIFFDTTRQIGKWDISHDREDLILFNREDVPRNRE